MEQAGDLLPYRTTPRAIRDRVAGFALAGAALLGLGMGQAAAQTAVATYHMDVSRSGWNAAETVLTPATVVPQASGGQFGLLTTIPLDDGVDAQPLVVPGVVIAGDPNPGTHDVVYVATQNNTIYAIDPVHGTVLLTRNFGAMPTKKRGCGTIAGNVGITGTPVIDQARQTMYVIVYTLDPKNGGFFTPNYRIHALSLSTLADVVAPVVVAGGQTLTDGTTLAFAATQQRQRPGLLEYNDTIYAAFGSFCDNLKARGWVFGWNADTLQPVNQTGAGTAIPMLTNHNATEPGGRFLSAIWMSGSGLAADNTGIFYVTGNSDLSGTTYDPVKNPEQSLLRLSLATDQILDIFTPYTQQQLDVRDRDFGSGGVMLVPSTAAGQPPMAVAAGKSGQMYLTDRTNLGGFTPGGPDKVLASVAIGPCWCAPTYFNDGWPTVVSSGGNRIVLWKITSSPTALIRRGAGPVLSTGQDPGFFTSVSSNGTTGTIIWAVSRPVSDVDPTVQLYAFAVQAPGKAPVQLFQGPAGQWTVPDHNANIVPVVANGRVYVASDTGLAIFGLAPAAARGGAP